MSSPQRAPATPAQRAIWLLHALDPDSSQYNIAWEISLRRRIDPACAQAAIDAVVSRHGALRTRFATDDGVPVQLVYDAAHIPVEQVDLAGHSRRAREAELRLLRRRCAAAPFDLANGPLLRATVVRCVPDAFSLLLCVHHSVADARSGEIITAEVLAVLDGAGPPTHPAPDYAEYARTQTEKSTAVARKALPYWRAQLDGVPWALDLPTDHPRGPAVAGPGGRYPLGLDRALLARLTELARTHRTTLFVVLLAATGVLLSRHSGHESVLVGCPVSGRDRRGLNDLVGPLVNTLPLRVDLADDPGVPALLGRLRDVVIGALTHHDLPFNEMVSDLRPERVVGHTPLVQAMVALHDETSAPLPDGVSVRALGSDTAKLDLAFTVSAAHPELSYVEYRADLFDEERIASLAGQLRTLLEALAAGPEGPVSRLPLLSSAAQEHRAAEWNATATDLPDAAIASFIREQTRRTPAAVAAVCGDTQLTYRGLDRLASRLAWRLLAAGVLPEDRVGLCTERSLNLVIGMLATLKAGAAFVPVPPELPLERRRLLLADCGARLLLAESEAAEDLHPQCPVVDLTGEDASAFSETDTADPVPDPAGPDTGPDVRPDQLACVLYTSGSTGMPKGVMITHRGVVNYVLWCLREFGVDAGEGVPVHGSIGFDTTVLTSVLPPLFAGQRVLLHPARYGPASALEEIAASGVDYTYVALTPSQLQAVMLERGEFAARLLVVGGEPLRGGMLPRSADGTLGHRVINEYGPTETVAACCAHPVAPDCPPEEAVPIGGPVANTTAHVLDRHGRPVPVGVPGELAIGGAGVARGYLHQAALTAAAFVPSPTGPPGSRVYRTGDLVRRRLDGALEFLGRTDDQVKIRGMRVEPDETQAVLARIDGVRDNAVLVRTAAQGGESELVAYVVPEGAAPDIDTLHEELARILPEHQIPAGYALMDALPVTPNGKIDRAALAAHLPERPGATGFVAPEGGTETRVARVWGEFLGAARVGALDNFFALGGHSLSAIRLLATLQDVFGVRVELHKLFANPTVRGLAAWVDAGSEEPDEPVRPAAVPGGRTPLNWAQEGIWLASQQRPCDTGYNSGAAHHLTGPLDTGKLALALSDVLARHDILRAVVTETDGGPVLTFLPSVEPEVIEVSDRSPQDRLRRAREVLDAETCRPFDLATGPLIRPRLLRLGPEEHVLILVIHHILVDGRSLDVLFADLAACYRARLDGAELPARPALQYADFTAWQRRRATSEVRDGLAAYWKRALAAAPPALTWPDDQGPAPGAPPSGPAGSRHVEKLPRALVSSLEELSRGAGVTLYSTLLTGYGLLLSRETGQQDVLITTPFDSRSRPETQDLVGLLLTMLVIRLRMDGRPSVTDLLHRTHRQVSDAAAHADLPLSALAAHTPAHRSRTGRTPLTQVMFDLQYAAESAPRLDGVTARPLTPNRTDSPADLALSAELVDDGLLLRFSYDTEAISRATAERFGDRMHRLLAAMAAGPGTAVGELPLTTEDERALLLRWSQGG